MTATAFFRWAPLGPLCTTLVAFWCCTLAAQPLPAAESAAAQTVAAAANAPAAATPTAPATSAHT